MFSSDSANNHVTDNPCHNNGRQDKDDTASFLLIHPLNRGGVAAASTIEVAAEICLTVVTHFVSLCVVSFDVFIIHMAKLLCEIYFYR